MVVSSVPKVAMACARKQYPSSNNNANKAGMTTIWEVSPFDVWIASEKLTVLRPTQLMPKLRRCGIFSSVGKTLQNKSTSLNLWVVAIARSPVCITSQGKDIFVFNRAVVTPQPSHYEAQEGTSMRGLDPTVFVLGEAAHMSLPWKGKAHVWWSIKYDQMRRMRLANAMNLKTLTGENITRSFSSRGTSALNILAIGWMLNCE